MEAIHQGKNQAPKSDFKNFMIMTVLQFRKLTVEVDLGGFEDDAR